MAHLNLTQKLVIRTLFIATGSGLIFMHMFGEILSINTFPNIYVSLVTVSGIILVIKGCLVTDTNHDEDSFEYRDNKYDRNFFTSMFLIFIWSGNLIYIVKVIKYLVHKI